MNEIKDCRGIPISEGDTIVYPGRRGSAMWLNVGTVQRPRIEGQLTLDVQKPNGKVVEIFETARVAVVASAQ
jgi:hypothetical protein